MGNSKSHLAYQRVPASEEGMELEEFGLKEATSTEHLPGPTVVKLPDLSSSFPETLLVLFEEALEELAWEYFGAFYQGKERTKESDAFYYDLFLFSSTIDPAFFEAFQNQIQEWVTVFCPAAKMTVKETRSGREGDRIFRTELPKTPTDPLCLRLRFFL